VILDVCVRRVLELFQVANQTSHFTMLGKVDNATLAYIRIEAVHIGYLF
jgi:hypothetical protein